MRRRWHPGLLLAIAVCGVLVTAVQAGRPFNHDTSWYFVAVGKWLEGARLYADVFEINPPLAFYLMAPPVVVAHWLDIAVASAFLAYLGLLVALVQVVVMRLLVRTPDLPPHARHVIAAAVFAALTVTALPVAGQREHLMVILFAPYAVLTALRPAGLDVAAQERVAIGALAALGLALKPHFLFAPALMFTVEIARTRSLRPALRWENLTAGALLALYPIAVALVHPKYFETIVPLGTAVYGAYTTDTLALLAEPSSIVCVASLLLLLRARNESGELVWPAWVLLAAASGFTISFLVQSKGWSYQAYPAHAYGLVAVAALATLGWEARLERFLVGLFAAWTAIAFMFVPAIHGPYDTRLAERLRAGVGPVGDAPSLMVLSSTLSVGFPLTNMMEADWTSRYPTLWLVPGVVRGLAEPDPTSERLKNLRWVRDFARETTARDFVKGRPSLVLVDRRARKPYFGREDIDFVRFFSQDAAFAEAWTRYRRSARIGGYEVWRRMDETARLTGPAAAN